MNTIIQIIMNITINNIMNITMQIIMNINIQIIMNITIQFFCRCFESGILKYIMFDGICPLFGNLV